MDSTAREIVLTEHGFWLGGEFRELNSRAILLAENVSEAHDVPHVYRDISSAFSAPELANADSENPVTLYIADGVYWIDDPKATDTVQKKDGYPLPFGMYVTCKALNIVGLSNDPQDTVIAGNRGQSHGCNGNYTMFHFESDVLNISNVTIGNYCCVDLVYPADIALNFPRRTDAITQAQLAIQHGEKLYAKNCRFVSRLNLCPVCGAERALYVDCHFESTDDALNGDAVYLNCDFDFYGSRPMYQTGGTGAVFIGCLFRSKIKSGDGESWQYFTKEGGPVAVIDCRFESTDNVRLGWTKYPDASLKCCQYRVTQNGKDVIIGGEGAAETALLDGKRALDAYVFERDGKMCANVGNLLGGRDGWDPLGLLDDARSCGKVGIPTLLKLSANRSAVVSGVDEVTVKAQSFLFTREPCDERVIFSLREGDEKFAVLRDNGDGSCTLNGSNNSGDVREIVINAYSESGLEASAAVTIEPFVIDAPKLVGNPYLTAGEKSVTLNYELSRTDRKDISEISWYRCDSPSGDGAVLCGVSKLDVPLRSYKYKEADDGKFLKAVIVPELTGSLKGDAVSVVTSEPVRCAEHNRLFTDFSDVPHISEMRDGYWAFDCAKPPCTEFGTWYMDENAPAWNYGSTGNGSVGVGLYQNTQGARLRFCPVHAHGGDMSITVKVDPAKTAGQGFGSAGQYLDIGIKFDTEKLCGYALRIIRVKEASDAVAVALLEYENGVSRYLTEPRLTSCFLTGCTLRVALNGNRLTAKAFTDTPQPSHKVGKYPHEIALEAEVAGNAHDGVLIWHTGTIGAGGWQNTAMIHSVEVEYE